MPWISSNRPWHTRRSRVFHLATLRDELAARGARRALAEAHRSVRAALRRADVAHDPGPLARRRSVAEPVGTRGDARP